MYALARIFRGISITFAVLFSVGWVRTYCASDRLSLESIGQETFGSISTGIETGRGQLMLFRSGIFAPNPNLTPRSKIRFVASPPTHLQPAADRFLTEAINVGDFGIFRYDTRSTRYPRHGGSVVPCAGTCILLPLWVPVAISALLGWFFTRLTRAATNRNLLPGFELSPNCEGNRRPMDL
jgi:hypothetical protein